jgi:peptidyl-prolyl cis-trans isomerase C
MRILLPCLRLSLAGALLTSLAPGCGSSDKPSALQPTATPAPAAPAPELKYGLTPEQAAQVLVEVGDTKITLGEFAERLGSQSPYLRARYNSPERRREFLENMVRFELLASEAEKRGLTHDEDVERVRRQVMVQQMMQDLFDKGGIALSDISEDEIKRYYNEHTAEFDKPAQVRASHILFKDRAEAERTLKELKQKPADQKPAEMELFRKLARDHTLDTATKPSGGDLRFFSESPDPAGETDEPTRPLAVRKAAFALANVGDLAPEAVKSELGYHVLKLTGRREPLKRSLDDARRTIQNKLWRQKREQAIESFVAELRSKANVQENAEALAKVQVKDGQGHVVNTVPLAPNKKPGTPEPKPK